MRRPGARAAAPLLALLLGGCGWFGERPPPTPADQDTPDHRACREEARTGPAMRALNAQRFPQNEFNTERLTREGRDVFVRAYRDCLRARGLALPGGVEPVRPR